MRTFAVRDFTKLKHIIGLQSKPNVAINVLQSSSQIDCKKHFREKINEILVLPGAKFTLFCLETQVQIYTRNGKDLFDIIASANPKLTQAEILGDSLTIVYAGQKNRVEARTFTNLTETTFTLINDTEVGKISLS